MRSAQKVLPFIRGSRNPRRPVIRTGQFRGVVALDRVKARGYVPPRRERLTLTVEDHHRRRRPISKSK